MERKRRVMGYGLWVMGYGLWVMGYGLLVIGFGTKACIPITHDPSPYHPPSGILLHLPYAAGTDAGAEAAAYTEAGVDGVLVAAVLMFHA